MTKRNAELEAAAEVFVSGLKAPERKPGRSRWSEASYVEVLVDANPKRAGGASRERFGLYRTGMTVGAYLDACVALEGNAKKRHKYLSDLTWDTERGFIAVRAEKPEPAPAESEAESEVTA